MSEFDHFNATANLAFHDLKEELELQDKTIAFEVSDIVASITIKNGDKLELEYELKIVVGGGKEYLVNTIQFLNMDGKAVRKEATILKKDGSPFEPVRLTREMMINDILDKYRSSDPFAKIVMSPYSNFYE
ncbi:MAG: hypothetical protein KAS16_06020 [Thermoplasmata archaeon]|nr:hypothetical protein [Thermoplasmata archaeon]